MGVDCSRTNRVARRMCFGTRSRSGVAAFVAVGGGSLWVSYNPTPSAVVRYDLLTLQAQRRFPFASGGIQAPFELVYGLGAAWVPLGLGDALLRIDGASGETQEIRVGSTPGDPAVGFDSVWVAMYGDDNVWRIDPLSGTAASTVNVGAGPFGVAVGDGSVWVTNNCDATVSRIDPVGNEVVRRSPPSTSRVGWTLAMGTSGSE